MRPGPRARWKPAIKRSMNLTSIRRESLALNSLAVDLSVAEGTHGLGAFAFAVSGVPSQALSGCFDIRKTAKNWIVSYGWGGRIRTSEWRDQNNTQHNQQVTDSTDRNIPLQSLRFPSLPPNLHQRSGN